MELTDTRLIDAAPAVVWAALLDAEVLKEAVPGCESLTGTVADGYEAVVVQKVGPVKARFSGVVTFSDVIEGQSLTLTGEGKGGAAGFAKGSAHVTLTPEGTGTSLSYQVEAKVGGKLAQLGSRIIDGFARKMADDFFERFADAVEGPKDDAPETDTETDADSGDEGGKSKGWFKKLWGGD